MYCRSVRLLPLTIPFHFKSQLLMRETVASRCTVGVCNYTVTFNNSIVFDVSVANEGSSSIQMYRQSVRLLPLTIPFYLSLSF